MAQRRELLYALLHHESRAADRVETGYERSRSFQRDVEGKFGARYEPE